METDTEWITVTGAHDRLKVIQQFVQAQAAQHHLGQEDTLDLVLAVEEAVINIIRHGYNESSEGSIRVGVVVDDSGLAVVIRDNARSFDPTTVSTFDPSTPLVERRLGGMGIYLMKKSVDEVSHRVLPDGGNELTLVKFYPSSEGTQ